METSDPATSGLESLLDEVLEPSSPLIERAAEDVADSMGKRYDLLMLKLEGNRKFMLEINERLGNLAREQNELNLMALHEMIGEIGSIALENAREISRIADVLGIGNGNTAGMETSLGAERGDERGPVRGREREAIDAARPQPCPAASPENNELKITSREKEILRELLLGKTNREISITLGINEKTVKNHLWKIYRKWNVTSRTQMFHKIMSR